MKKFLGILAIAGTLVACGNNAETEATNADTNMIVQPDTMGVIVDTTVTRDTIGQGIGTNPVTPAAPDTAGVR